MASAGFEGFRFSFFEDPDSPRNGLDMKALGTLEGAERSRAEDMLLQYLPDTRGVIGLGALGSRGPGPRWCSSSKPTMGRQFRAGLSGENPLANPARSALARRRDRVLASADEPMRRLTAVEALHDFRDPVAVGALVKALDDPEGLARHHAARSRSTAFPTLPKTRST
jgi:hypothetical protein